MNQPRRINARVFRFDPQRDSSPHYDEYRLEVEGVTKVLELLDLIYQKYDPTLAYRSSCRSGKCGVCSVRMNGRAVLACRETVPEGTILIEPLDLYPVLRDLIVDRGLYDQRVAEMAAVTAEAEAGKASEGWERLDVQAYEKLAACIECLLCDSTCPVLALSSKDYGGPALFRYDAFLEADRRRVRGGLTLSERLHLDHCSTCKACTEVCPKEVEVFDDAILPLRRRTSFQERLPEMQKDYARVIRETGSLFTPYRVPLKEQLPEVVTPEEVREEVIFFPGCMINMRFQAAGKALVRVLSSLGVKVHFPREMTCCGGPLHWTGQEEGFEEIASRNIDIFERTGISTLVVACAGCGMTLKKDYRKLFEAEGRKGLALYDFTEYLERLRPTFRPGNESVLRVTYHDPCHLRRGQEIWGEPRRLLKALPNVKFVELKDSGRCCGGMLGTVNRDLSSALARQKAEAIIEADVEAVVTECPFCKDMISKALKKENKRIPVYIVAELIEELYGESSKSHPSR